MCAKETPLRLGFFTYVPSLREDLYTGGTVGRFSIFNALGLFIPGLVRTPFTLAPPLLSFSSLSIIFPRCNALHDFFLYPIHPHCSRAPNPASGAYPLSPPLQVCRIAFSRFILSA